MATGNEKYLWEVKNNKRGNASQAVATDATTTMTLANELRAALVEAGIIKGSA